MSVEELRGEEGEKFREGSARAAKLRTDFARGEVHLRESRTEEGPQLRTERGLRLEIPEQNRLIRHLRREYDGKVVAVNVDTGGEIAVADDTHELTELLLDLEYNEGATMIVRCHGGEHRGHPASSAEVRGSGSHSRSANR